MRNVVMTSKRDRWIALSGLLLGFGLAFAIVDLAALLFLPSGIEGSSLRVFLGIGVLITGVSATLSLLIRVLKLRNK